MVTTFLEIQTGLTRSGLETWVDRHVLLGPNNPSARSRSKMSLERVAQACLAHAAKTADPFAKDGVLNKDISKMLACLALAAFQRDDYVIASLSSVTQISLLAFQTSRDLQFRLPVGSQSTKIPLSDVPSIWLEEMKFWKDSLVVLTESMEATQTVGSTPFLLLSWGLWPEIFGLRHSLPLLAVSAPCDGPANTFTLANERVSFAFEHRIPNLTLASLS